MLLAPRTAASGEAPSASGFEFAFRSGFVIPAGNSTTEGALSNGVGIQIPLVADVGYRLNEHIFIGVTGQYTFDTSGNGGCVFDANCSAHDARVGAEVELHPRGRAAFDPWFGVGFGYEWLSSRNTSFGSTQSMTFRGFDFLVVDIGLDFALGKFRVGPFASFAMGQFDHATGRDDDGNPSSFSIDAKSLHYWFSVGLKLTLSP